MQHQDTRFLELLQRWSDGDFSRADERELRGLAATDDFRQEALDGFLAAPESDHAARLNVLRARLRAQTGKKRFTLPQLLTAIAAAMVLLIGVVVVWPTRQQQPARDIAQTQAPQNTPPAPDAAIAQTDTRAEKKTAAAPAGPTVPEYRPAGSAESLKEEQVTADVAVADDKISNTPNLQESNAKPPPMLPAPATNNPPAPWNSAPAAKQTDRVTSRAKAQQVPPLPPGAAADTVWNQTDTQPQMEALKKDEIPPETTPANGWEAFREYLRQGARLPLEARNNNVSGTVRLQFTLNANGEPQNFVFLRRLGFGCEQEAVRLVQAWEWVRGKNPNVTVDVPFVR